MPLPRPVLAAALAFCGTVVLPHATRAQVEAYCVDAHAFLAEERGMAAVAEPFTIDDWRTDQEVDGCQVTAAGLTHRSARAEIEDFFEALRGAGWERSPDAQDAPHEAMLRFRKNDHDCLFAFYASGMLMTEAEAIVEEAKVPGPGERRVNFHVVCLPAMESAG